MIFPPVDADSGVGASDDAKTEESSGDDESDGESDLEATQTKKKFRREKIGFRDRKVRATELLVVFA